MNTSYYITLAQEYEEINFSSLIFTLFVHNVIEVVNTKLIVRYLTTIIPQKKQAEACSNWVKFLVYTKPFAIALYPAAITALEGVPRRYTFLDLPLVSVTVLR